MTLVERIQSRIDGGVKALGQTTDESIKIGTHMVINTLTDILAEDKEEAGKCISPTPGEFRASVPMHNRHDYLRGYYDGSKSHDN